MIVVDANVIIYLVRETTFTALAQEVYIKDSDWVVPEIWEAEVLNGLLREVYAGHIEQEQAILAANNAASILSGKVHKCEPEAVLNTAHNAGLTAYDAYYVVLARSLEVPLVTEDAKVIRSCPDVAYSLKTFLRAQDNSRSVRESKSPYKRRRKNN